GRHEEVSSRDRLAGVAPDSNRRVACPCPGDGMPDILVSSIRGGTMQCIVPNIWCRGNAVDVGELYARVFPHATSEVTAYYPSEGLPDFQKEFAGRELVVDVTIRGHRLRLINAGDEFRPTPALSFLVNIDPADYGGDEAAARADLERMWVGLGEGGTVRMALDEYPFSPYYGWVEDPHGVNWQFMLTNSAAGDRLFLLPDLLFTGAH